MAKTQSSVKTQSKVVCEDFTQFANPVHAKFKEMSKGELYVTDAGNELFDEYLKAFPAGTNPMMKARTLHDCVTCRQFIRRLGKVVQIKDGKMITVWSNLDLPHPYKEVADKLDELVQCASVIGVFRTKEKKFGESHNYDKDKVRHDHFYGEVSTRHQSADPGTQIGEKTTIFQVMKRGLSELRVADFEAVLDLIESNGLYKGEEFRDSIRGFLELLHKYNSSGKTDLFVWENLDNRNSRFRNTAIGTLLVDLSEGKSLDQAVKSFETKVAPTNYKRPTAVITQKMVEQAVEKITELGLHGAMARRYAKFSDVSVADVLFVDNETQSKMKDGITMLLESSVKKAPPDLSKAVKMSSEDFLTTILPTAKSLEVFVENRHQGNFVSLTGADGPERLFKWDNNFAWSYDGDVTDSVKQRVKAAGGKIDCKLRVSLSWFNTDDLDLHAKTPRGLHVSFMDKAGILDVDMNASSVVRNAVENLAFNRLEDGVYEVWVNQYRRRETIDVGFTIEVEFGGVVHQYSYPKTLKDKENVQCFKLHIKKGELTKIETTLTGGAASQEKWGVKTETLVPVASVMFSPNHWGENKIKVGAKHLIFALKNCRNPDSTRTIFNEFLDNCLSSYGKVLEVLGNKTKAKYSEEQISGVGFTAARGDSVTVVVDGKRSYLLTF